MYYFKGFFDLWQFGVRNVGYIGISGYAQSLLHFGPKITPQIEAQLEFKIDNGSLDIIYTMCLGHAAGDTLIFAEETATRNGLHLPQPSTTYSLGAGHQETKINKAAQEGTPTIANTIKPAILILKKIR